MPINCLDSNFFLLNKDFKYQLAVSKNKRIFCVQLLRAKSGLSQ